MALALAILVFLSVGPRTFAQPRPYIGFVYPAGGQQGTTFQVRLGGQGLDDVSDVLVTGSGVSARIAEYYRPLNAQDLQLVNEQLRILKRKTMSESARSDLMAAESSMMMAGTNAAAGTNETALRPADHESIADLINRIEKRTLEFVAAPASPALAALVLVEVTAAADAEPGEREIRLVTARGVSNPLVFYIGQFPEVSKRPMLTATKQILGKESLALRKRLPGDDEDTITIPCTVNGQIGSGEVNRYRFQAHKGQRLVITTLARELVPFIADAVPGWFQPVLALYDANGKELAYDDDYRFNPDPTLLYEIPEDGEYSFTIRDSIYRGREDFVYRITIGELPFITSVFPLGAPLAGPGESVPQPGTKPEVKGWNLADADLVFSPGAGGPESYSLVARRKGLVSNRVPFALDELPETVETEPNDSPAAVQRVTLPTIVNGRINRPGDWDVFQFEGRSNQVVVAEVMARRLGSPLDSIIKLTDSSGNVLAFNDDHEDLVAGLNTHAADSFLMARLPANGAYRLAIGDTAQQGGEEYAYRLRLSEPRPDFALRVVPSSVSLRAKNAAQLTVYALRRDGFNGPIKLTLKDPPPGFSANPITMVGTQTVARLNLKTTLTNTPEPVKMIVVGSARLGARELLHAAVPAEDHMQAFLWRQLVAARDLQALVFDPSAAPSPKRVAPVVPPPAIPTNAPALAESHLTNRLAITNTVAGTNSLSGTNSVAASKPKFTKQQVAYRLRELKLLYEEGMLTDDFYCEKVGECETGE